MPDVRAAIRRRDVSLAEAAALGTLVVGALVALGLLYLLTQPSASPAEPIAVEGTVEGAPSEQPTEVVVHVAGLVRRPGLVTLPAGARVADAVAAAGGPKAKAGLDSLNLARVVVDGEQLVVGAAGAPAAGSGSGAAAGVAGSASGAAADGVVHLNQADVSQLEELPGIGPVLAQRIIDHRDAIGGFKEVRDLRDVPGIGEKTFQSLAPLVSI